MNKRISGMYYVEKEKGSLTDEYMNSIYKLFGERFEDSRIASTISLNVYPATNSKTDVDAVIFKMTATAHTIPECKKLLAAEKKFITENVGKWKMEYEMNITLNPKEKNDMFSKSESDIIQ